MLFNHGVSLTVLLVLESTTTRFINPITKDFTLLGSYFIKLIYILLFFIIISHHNRKFVHKTIIKEIF